MSSKPATRRRGAQPGNTNRLKHGLYSRRIAAQGAGATVLPPDPDFHLALARQRLVQLLRRQQTVSIDDWLSYEHAILHYVSLIAAFLRARTHRGLMNAGGLGDHDGHPSAGLMGRLPILGANAPSHSADLFLIRTSEHSPRKSLSSALTDPFRTANIRGNK